MKQIFKHIDPLMGTNLIPPFFQPPKSPLEQLISDTAKGFEIIGNKLKDIVSTTPEKKEEVLPLSDQKSDNKVTETPIVVNSLIESLENICEKVNISSKELNIIEVDPGFLELIQSSSVFRPLYYTALYRSIPDDISHEIWRYIKEISPFKRDKGVVGRSLDYEDILRKYTKKAANKAYFAVDMTASAGGFLVNLIRFLKDKAEKLSWGKLADMLPDFHIQAAILVIIWTKMLWDLSRCKSLNWSLKQVTNLATTIVIASLQLFVREFPPTKPIVSAIRTSYGIFADIISNMPEDIKRICPDIIKNAAPTWHVEIAEAMKVPYINYSQALNMLYTFRVGDNYVYQIKRDMDEKTIVRTLTALSPFPVDGEEKRLVLLHQHKAIY